MNLAYALRGELITLLNKRLMTHDQLNLEVAKSLPNNHITDPSEEGKKHDHPNYVEASSSKFIKQGLFLFLFAHALKSLVQSLVKKF